MSPAAKRGGVAALAGLVFGAGLALSGMTKPRKVIGFLDFGGTWDPSLAFVMLGAVGVHMLAYRWIRRRTAPVFADAFVLPTGRRIDGKLVGGSALFGVGWALAGYCPGPSITALGAGVGQAAIFVLTMLIGMLTADKLGAISERRGASRASGGGSVEHGAPRESALGRPG